jgi:hypothetical protein
MAFLDPRAWVRPRPGQRPKPVPRMSLGEIQADNARREAEQQAERMQQQAELERGRLEYEAGIQLTPVPAQTTIEGFTEIQF